MYLRRAKANDAEAITTVINAAFRLAESFLVDRDRVDQELVHSLLKKGTFLVADDNGAVQGCVYVELQGERAYLGLLSVDPQHQKSGLGSKLMDAAEIFCAGEGALFADLRIVSVRRELPSFYQHRGYIATGTSPFPTGFDPKVPCHFIEMSKPLAGE